MITVNLEKELVRQNKKLLSKENKLKIDHLDRVAIGDTEPLDRIGMSGHIKEAEDIRDGMRLMEDGAARFNQERVFHISQIESLCMKYYLRFLPSNLYKGELDNELIPAIQSFELAYNVRMNSSGYSRWENDYGNSFIAAPKESFKLQEKPLDPLLFYKINDEYFYLVHKWGNDLSIFRRALGVLPNVSPLALLPIVFIVFWVKFCINSNVHILESILFGMLLSFLSFLLAGAFMGLTGRGNNDGLGIIKKNQWRSIIK